MVDINEEIKRIKKMPPEKRLLALKELKEELKKKREKEKDDVEEASEELSEEAVQELRIIEDIEKPKVRQATSEEKEKLEEKVKDQEKIEERFITPEINRQYELRPTSPVQDFAYREQKLYSEFKTTIEEGREISPELRGNIQTLITNLYQKERAIESGRYNPNEDIHRKLTEVEKAARSLHDKIIQYSRN